jgi:hypothetical protein
MTSPMPTPPKKEDMKSEQARGRLPTFSELDAMVDSAHERGMKEAVEELRRRQAKNPSSGNPSKA